MPSNNNNWLTLIIISLGILISAVNASSINLINPTLARVFNIDIDQVQWVVTVYLLVVSALMLLFGRIGDLIGSHKIYNGGFLIFTLGSLFCGLSGDFNLLLAARVVQGVGAAMLMATGIGIVATTFPLEQRGQAIGITVIAVGLGNMGGPTLGGFILTHFTWPMIFYINVPFGIIFFILGLRYLRSPVPENRNAIPPLDRIGALLLAILISALLLCLSGSFKGSGWFVLLFIAILPLFVWYEKRNPAPLFNFELMRNRRFTVGNLVAFLSYFAQTLIFFLMPFYMEEVLLLPTSTVGVMMMISPLLMAIAAPLSGTMSDKIGALRLMPIALALQLAAVVFFLNLRADSSLTHLAVGFILLGSSIGMLNSPNNSEIMTAAGFKYSGYASGFVATVRNLAFCFGTAASAGGFTALFDKFAYTREFIDAYVEALHLTVIAAAIIVLVSLFFCIWLKRAQDKIDRAQNITDGG
ncbi:MAG: MFS transporter [Syntrophomonadaceae bacterium]|nr:MFS transporter [Syntrophomonadaceae bacterium]